MSKRKSNTKRVHGEVQGRPAGAFEEVYAIVRAIPRGRVMTYGQISTLMESTLSPVAVGWAMSRAPESVPWQRVVNASGGCSTTGRPDMPPNLQQGLLEKEKIEFHPDQTLDLTLYRWTPERKNS